MSGPGNEVADIIKRFGQSFAAVFNPNAYQKSVLQAISQCRTSSLGGHKYRCPNCNSEQISYNSCRNRHCPKCQVYKQAFWVEDRMGSAYKCKHYHMVFTVPEELNALCVENNSCFYNLMFASVWETLQQFGYTKYGVETGAICILHTWGQNLSLHPHIHCIVPSLGYSINGEMKHVGKNGKYLFPVRQLSVVFKTKFLGAVSKHIKCKDHRLISKAWEKPWVIFCEPSMTGAQHVMRYFGSYVHRVAISNSRIVSIDGDSVVFKLKDYRDYGNTKTIRLKGEEFLRRFCMHILGKGFVKIRYYGIYSVRFRSTVHKDKIEIKVPETTLERIKRLTDIDICLCPKCKKGKPVIVEILPRVRSPSVF